MHYPSDRDFMTDAKSRLKDYVESVTVRSPRAGKGFYVCPCCNSGGHDRGGTGAFKLYPDKGRGPSFHCFSCGASGDIFELAGLVNKTTSFRAKKEAVAEFMGVDLKRDVERTQSQGYKPRQKRTVASVAEAAKERAQAMKTPSAQKQKHPRAR